MFSERVKELRKENKLTQQELADKLNCSLSKIGMWEGGRREPTKDDLILLSNIFNVSSDYLLCLTDSKYKNLDSVKTISAHRAGEIEQLSEEGLKELDNFIELLKLKYKK